MEHFLAKTFLWRFSKKLQGMLSIEKTGKVILNNELKSGVLFVG